MGAIVKIAREVALDSPSRFGVSSKHTLRMARYGARCALQNNFRQSLAREVNLPVRVRACSPVANAGR
jgi:hypothetical protein